MKTIEIKQKLVKEALDQLKAAQQDSYVQSTQNVIDELELVLHQPTVMSNAIAFAEWVDWNKYERFEGRKDLWYDKKSSYSNPLPIKTTEDLWNEFVKH